MKYAFSILLGIVAAANIAAVVANTEIVSDKKQTLIPAVVAKQGTETEFIFLSVLSSIALIGGAVYIWTTDG